MDLNNLIYFSASLGSVLFFIVAWLIYRVIKLDQVRREFFASGLKKNFEQILVDQNRSITKINQELEQQDQSLSNLYQSNRNNFQKIGFMRFNPFDDSGGNISFALALLNAENDGIVISSLHGRDGTRVYAKSIKAGKSESKLTEEEIRAIQEAK